MAMSPGGTLTDGGLRIDDISGDFSPGLGFFACLPFLPFLSFASDRDLFAFRLRHSISKQEERTVIPPRLAMATLVYMEAAPDDSAPADAITDVVSAVLLIVSSFSSVVDDRVLDDN